MIHQIMFSDTIEGCMVSYLDFIFEEHKTQHSIQSLPKIGKNKSYPYNQFNHCPRPSIATLNVLEEGEDCLGSLPTVFCNISCLQMVNSSPCSRAIEAERIPRSRFKNVNADSHSEIILVTGEG